jgi:hypothetical protein
MTPGASPGIGPGRKGYRMNDEKLFARITPLFDVGLLSNARVLIAGCGSGGSQVALQLVMAAFASSLCSILTYLRLKTSSATHVDYGIWGN